MKNINMKSAWPKQTWDTNRYECNQLVNRNVTCCINIKFIMLVIFVCVMSKDANAQHALSIDASQVISTFSFSETVDPTNFELFGTGEYNPLLSGAYSVGYRYDALLGFTARGSLGMRKAGASTVIDQTNYQWEFQYIELKAGAGYRLDFGEKLGVYATLSPYITYLLNANQRLDNEDFDIKKSGDINTIDYGVHFTPGVLFTVSEFISAYGEFSYMAGLKNLETGSTDQKSYNIAYALTLGVAFAIK